MHDMNGDVSQSGDMVENIVVIAIRFAAKESVMKALGRGWSREVGWTDIEVVRERGSRPTIRLHGRTAAYAAKLGIRTIALAITHTAETAMAQVIAEN